jgi:hypothetical protein
MVRAIVHKEEGRYLLEVSVTEGDKAGWVEGQELKINVPPAMPDAERRQRIDAIMDDVVVEYREAFEYLAK